MPEAFKCASVSFQMRGCERISASVCSAGRPLPFCPWLFGFLVDLPRGILLLKRFNADYSAGVSCPGASPAALPCGESHKCIRNVPVQAHVFLQLRRLAHKWPGRCLLPLSSCVCPRHQQLGFRGDRRLNLVRVDAVCRRIEIYEHYRGPSQPDRLRGGKKRVRRGDALARVDSQRLKTRKSASVPFPTPIAYRVP